MFDYSETIRAIPIKSASLVQLSLDAFTSQIGSQLLPHSATHLSGLIDLLIDCFKSTFRDSDILSFKCHGRQLAH